MDPERARQISSKGGKSSQASGKGHRFTPENSGAAGSAGGSATVEKMGPGYMAEIGRRGGQAARRKREEA